MPDDSDARVTRADRRHRREQRRRRQRLMVIGAVTAVITVLIGLIATDTLRLPGEPSPKLADASTGAATEAVVGDVPEVESATRELTVEDPLRLWVGGDSLAGALGPALGSYASESGVVRTWYDSHTSSGLVDRTIIDWPEEADQQMVEINPEAVVFIMGANDNVVVDDAGDWRDDYAAKTGEMMDILTGTEGRPVYWVGSPILGDSEMSDRVAEVNQVFVDQAEQRPSVAYVNAYDLFAPGGVYSDAFENRDGEVVTMRDGDGVHFTGEGARYLAGFVWDLIDSSFQVSRYAVPGATQPVEESGTAPRLDNPGSGATTSTSPTSGSATVQSSEVTAPPATEPVQVAPPVDPAPPPAPTPTEPTPPPDSTSTTGPVNPGSGTGGAGDGS